MVGRLIRRYPNPPKADPISWGTSYLSLFGSWV